MDATKQSKATRIVAQQLSRASPPGYGPWHQGQAANAAHCRPPKSSTQGSEGCHAAKEGSGGQVFSRLLVPASLAASLRHLSKALRAHSSCQGEPQHGAWPGRWEDGKHRKGSRGRNIVRCSRAQEACLGDKEQDARRPCEPLACSPAFQVKFNETCHTYSSWLLLLHTGELYQVTTARNHLALRVLLR